MTNGHTKQVWWIAATAVVVLGVQGGAGARAQSVGVTTAGQTVAVERDGDFVRVRTPGQQVTVDDGWRRRVTVNRGSSDDLLVELGAREAGGSIRMALSGDVLFDFDSTAIRPGAADVLGKIAQVIRDRSHGDVYVVGHTDAVGTDAYNQKLSEDRAAAVIAWLSVREGIPSSIMLGRGMGKAQPVADNTRPNGADNPEGRAKNRRVEIFLATRDGVDLRGAVEVTTVDTGASSVVVERSADRQTMQVNGRTIDVQNGADGPRVQVGGTTVEAPQAAAAQSRAGNAAAGGGASAGPAGRTLRPVSPVSCTGVRSVELDSVVIDTSGVAIETTGACKVTIRNSEIRSKTVAITATGMSRVEIVDSLVVGSVGAVGVTGTGQVSAKGSELRGRVETRGLGKFDDLGGNTLP